MKLKDPQISKNALTILEKRYLLRDETGKVIETPKGLFIRVARAISRVEENYGASKKEIDSLFQKFYNMMAEFRFMPNSPTLMNADTPLGQLSACFVLPVGDSMEEIFEAVKRTAIIHKTGGGTGFSFSRLRPKNDVVKSTGGVASGPVSFMRVFNEATEAVKQGGKRRGANMGILKVDHPDIFEFINAKEKEGELANFNISVAVTDKFMEALEKGEEFELINPRNKEVVRKVNPREIWDKLVYGAWRNGEPGIIFLDTINRYNPTPGVGEIESTNPCVTIDTWVMTENGPRQVRDLIGKPFVALINGQKYRSNEKGFFSTGIKKIYKLKTKEGFELRLTADHPVLKVREITRYSIETEWIKAGELKNGEKILINNHRGIKKWAGKYTEEDGYLVGLLLGDGTIKQDKVVLSSWGSSEGAVSVREIAYGYAQSMPHRSDFKGWIEVKGRDEFRMATGYLKKLAFELGLKPGYKVITRKMEEASSDFYRGLLRGLFDADGCVIGTHTKGVSIRLAQSDLEFLKSVQRMLIRLGIFSRIYENRRPAGTHELPDGKGGKKEYQIKPQHELVISNDNIFIFHEIIGFGDIEKHRKLEKAIRSYKRIPNRERFVATVEEVKFDREEEAFDVQIPGINAFDANGLVVHNCGEQPLLPYESCNLGSINLAKFVKGKPLFLELKRVATFDEAIEKIDWDGLRETVRDAVHFLDNVIDANNFPFEEIAENTRGNRKVGLGIMGFADMLYQLAIPYRSEDALKIAEKVMEFIENVAVEKSVELGKQKGSFPNIDKSIFKPPRRNATVTTIAPTGTISMIADTSYGIEPIFTLVYVKHVLDGEDLLYANKYFEMAAKELGFYSKGLMEKLASERTIKGISEIPEFIQEIFDTTFDVTPEQHVKIQAAFQKYVDNAVSKTINMPNSATVEDVEKVYRMAYKLGLKGLTVYRDGSRQEQVIKVAKEEKRRIPGSLTPRPRPITVSGKTYKMVTDMGSLYVTVNEDGHGPFEVFVHLGKSGSASMAFTEAIGRLISLCLRTGVSPKAVIKQLKGIKSSTPVRQENGDVVFSVPDAIAKVLEKYLAGGEQLELLSSTKPLSQVSLKLTFGKEDHKEKEEHYHEAEICPECGGVLVFQEGCYVCRDCGYSKCE